MRAFSLDQSLFGASDPLLAAKPAAPEGTGAQRQALETEGPDASGSTDTSYTISVDDTFDGVLSGGDADWVAVTLEAGQSYVIQVWGRDGSAVGLNDPVLRLYDGNGVEVAINDDVDFPVNTFSLIEYTAPVTGTYYVAVEGFGSSSGRYTLQVADDVFSPEQVATYMTEFDWGFPTPIRFDAGVGDTLSVNLTALTPAGQQLARWALESWEIALGIDFVETTLASANIVFDDNQPGAFAGSSSINTDIGIYNQASVNIGTGWIDEYGTTIDSYSFETYLHEIGHALGLGHAGPYDGGATYGTDNVYRNDSTQMTLMSYFDAVQNTFVSGDRVAIISPMIADLVAVHSLYGTPQAYAGDTTWGANSNVGGWLGAVFAEVFEGVDTAIYDGGPIGFTIFDTGGIDTVDLSPVSVAQYVDIRPGAVSSMAGLEDNVVIAQGTVLENVIGGSGADEIIGNAADNRIEGGLGNDSIFGAGGIDTAVLPGTLAAADISQSGDSLIITTSAGTDTYTNIELFEFSDGTYSAAALIGGTPVVVPTEGPDSLVGTAGDDRIDALGGNDTVRGGEGDDGLKGGDGDDMLFGGPGNDRLPGGNGNDISYGGAGDDRLGGGFGDDYMDGGDGNDGGGAGPGSDTIIGGAGNDRFNGGYGSDYIDMGEGDDRSGASFGNDTMFGGSGNDLLTGGDGNDEINGDAGDDTINSGTGDDTVTGGEGADLFIFNSLFGGDLTVITDFEDGIDTIRVTGLRSTPDELGRLDITDILYAGEVAASFTYGNHTVIVQGLSAADLTADDFIFG